ncbi:YibE/F family protein [Rossellomorea sp. FS2]|uniref:YibE/F-like family protein n=2 Tax=Bacillaceae TaxID=186817 RepID=A0A165J4Y6_9BACI|nr:yibE/F-like family protein [Rossellomorea marisflavi]QHA36443.1 YibE/F family protein [Rossellomorea marisflavi]TYO72625.1 YibE/F family protein [Rossellomorea marisflavi]
MNVKKRNNMKKWLFYIVLVALCVLSIYFVYHNEDYYDRSIAEVTGVKITGTRDVTDPNGNEDRLYEQEVFATVKNGPEKGRSILLSNTYSRSKAYDQEYKPGNDLFVSINEQTDGQGQLRGSIDDVKRDTYLVIIGWVFIFLMILVGKRQGLYSLGTLCVNAVILSFALDSYLNHDRIGLLGVCGLAVLLFTSISLLLVNGFNRKTYAAVISTLVATFVTLLISFIVIKATAANGLRYEEMQFLTRPTETVFMAGILVGCLGAVMDVAITLSASIFTLYEKNPSISTKALKEAGFEIGRDIMGTMTNIMFFVYISGAMPMLILYFKNASPLGFTLSMNLSLELARALTGGIGIVLAIPIGIFISINLVNRRRAVS